MKELLVKAKQRLEGLSFRTGIIILVICAICYIVSFAQMLLPLSVAAKGVLWTLFFGLAKTFQYTALLILGTAGVARIRRVFKQSKE